MSGLTRTPRRNNDVLWINVPDFLGRTMALRAEHSGVLLLLMMAYARSGSLPSDERQLATIAACHNIRIWRTLWPRISGFFTENGEGQLSIPMVDEWIVERAGRLEVPMTEWNRLRLAVFQRDSFACRYCGEPDLTDVHCDHVIPRARGGLSTLENLVTSCQRCNLSKGSMTPEEWALARTIPAGRS